MSRKFRLALTIAAAIALIGTVSGIAIAVTSSPKITACYAKSAGTFNGVKHLKGEVRIIPANGRCYAFETKTAWNITGPRGATGATGPQGPAGPTVTASPTGDPTVDPEVTRITKTISSVASTENQFVMVDPNIPSPKWIRVVSYALTSGSTVGCKFGSPMFVLQEVGSTNGTGQTLTPGGNSWADTTGSPTQQIVWALYGCTSAMTATVTYEYRLPAQD